MEYLDIYRLWLNSQLIDAETKKELRAIHDQPKEIEDRFYKHLEFGTGGVRGVLGAERNRINRYTIRRVTQGLADYIATLGPTARQRGVVITYDTRHQSKELGMETALTLRANGIKAYLFKSFSPTPLLSFSVRELTTIAGIVITASHNPPEYNGFKVYWEDGGQIIPTLAKEIVKKIDQMEEIPSLPENQQSFEITWVGRELEEKYISCLKKICLHPETIAKAVPSFKIVYTPLHGTGNELVQRILHEVGFSQVYVVPEQEQPDPNFSTVKSPNPEERDAFQMALSLGEIKEADIILATDPDCDRVGVAVRNREGDSEFLTGNQTGALLLHYLLSEQTKRGSIPANAVIVKTIVTSQMGRTIAEKYGVEMIETLTGFKYIGEQIRLFEETGEKTFLFGYEESYGYLAGTFVRDKDGVMASMLICEMAAYYKTLQMTLCDVLHMLYQEYGYFLEDLVSRTFKGKEGTKRIQNIMNAWRAKPPKQIGSKTVVELRDYDKQEAYHFLSDTRSKLDLPKSNTFHVR